MTRCYRCKDILFDSAFDKMRDGKLKGSCKNCYIDPPYNWVHGIGFPRRLKRLNKKRKENK